MLNPLLTWYKVTAKDARNGTLAQVCLLAESERQAADWLHYCLLDEMQRDKCMPYHSGIKVISIN